MSNMREATAEEIAAHDAYVTANRNPDADIEGAVFQSVIDEMVKDRSARELAFERTEKHEKAQEPLKSTGHDDIGFGGAAGFGLGLALGSLF